MSTTIKRVALVAVAALGLGVVSVAPSQATVSSVVVTAVDGTAKVAGTTVTADTTTAGTITVSGLFDNTADSITVQVVAKSAPSDSTGAEALLGYLETATSRSSIVKNGVNAAAAQFESTTASFLQVASDAIGYAGAKFSVQLNPSAGTVTAGTYVFTAIVKTFKAGALDVTSTKDVSIVVTASSLLADATSTSYIALTGTDAKDATSDSATVTGSKAAGSVQVANIYVTQKNATSTANEAMTATITGPGLIQKNDDADEALGSTAGRSISVTSGKWIGVYADGTSGEATITITGVKSGLVLGVEKVTFYDTKPASAAVAVKKAFVAASTTATESVFLVSVKDAAGNAITDIKTLTAAATDTSSAQVVGGASVCSTTYNAIKGGFYCNVKGLSATKFGKVNYTFTVTGKDALATVVTATADVTFSSKVAAKITITPASTTANPGDVVVYTYTATDANGYAVPDADYNLTGTEIFADVVASGFATDKAPFALADTITTVNGVATSKGTLAIAGTAKITWTLKGSATVPADTAVIAKAINATDVAAADVTISNPGVDAATDAANEAAQAASDATDAALAAADAADAATTKAQEAVDAVATLSAEVSKLITALKAQITTLTNLVIKIQKKVKA